MKREHRATTTTDGLELLRLDPGTRTLGQLLQERQWAVMEIERLRSTVDRLNAPSAVVRPPAPSVRTTPTVPATALKKATVTVEPSVRAAQAMTPRLLRLRDVQDLVGLSRSTIYQMIARGRFPAGTRVAERARRWPLAEIVAWQDALARVGSS